MSEEYMRLKKRSINPQDPPLTWEEMNENFRDIEDVVNNLIDNKINTSEKAQPEGVATLDDIGKLNTDQLPDIDCGNF